MVLQDAGEPGAVREFQPAIRCFLSPSVHVELVGVELIVLIWVGLMRMEIEMRRIGLILVGVMHIELIVDLIRVRLIRIDLIRVGLVRVELM